MSNEHKNIPPAPKKVDACSRLEQMLRRGALPRKVSSDGDMGVSSSGNPVLTFGSSSETYDQDSNHLLRAFIACNRKDVEHPVKYNQYVPEKDYDRTWEEHIKAERAEKIKEGEKCIVM